MNVSKIASRSLAALALGATLAAAAPAQSYYKRNLPDYDQRRNTLPGKGGMYCVPTAYVDLFRFMSWCGMTDMDANFGNGYADTTNFMAVMGILMGTTPAGGTGGTAALNASINWTNGHTNALVAHFAYGPNTYWFGDTMKNMVSTGAMVDIAYGRYHLESNGYLRSGGHSIALAGYDWTNPGVKSILVADPAADDGNDTMQGPFSIDAHVTQPTVILTSAGKLLALPRYDPAWSGKDGKWQAVVDYMHGILPLYAGWFSTPATKSLTSTFHAAFPFQIEDGVNRPVHELTVDLPGTVRDWCMDHGDMAIYVLSTEGLVSRVDLVSKAVTRLASIPAARQMVCAGSGLSLYVRAEGERSDSLIRIERGTNKQTAMALPKGAIQLEPDPVTQGIVALYPAGVLASIDEDLRKTASRSVGLPAGDGALSLAVECDGSVSVARVGSRIVVRTTRDGASSRFLLPAVMSPRTFQGTDSGRLLMQDGERLVTLNANGGLSKSQFDGMTVHGRVRFSQSWRAFKPADISGLGWQNVLPERGQP